MKGSYDAIIIIKKNKIFFTSLWNVHTQRRYENRWKGNKDDKFLGKRSIEEAFKTWCNRKETSKIRELHFDIRWGV
jgi:hypothetical protein